MKLVRDRDMPSLGRGESIRATEPYEVDPLFATAIQESFDAYIKAKKRRGGDWDEDEAENALATLLGTVESYVRNQSYRIDHIRGIAGRQRKERGDYDRALVLVEREEP